MARFIKFQGPGNETVVVQAEAVAFVSPAGTKNGAGAVVPAIGVTAITLVNGALVTVKGTVEEVYGALRRGEEPLLKAG